jgi:hypothetical protein
MCVKKKNPHCSWFDILNIQLVWSKVYQTISHTRSYIYRKWCIDNKMSIAISGFPSPSDTTVNGRYSDMFAITNYHWLICWMVCFIVFVRLEGFFFILALTTGNPVYLIPTKVYSGCDRSAEDAYSSNHLILPSHLSEVMLPYTRFRICPLDYDYILHIVRFVILYIIP